ncbi:Rieske (2Fe-2S) protein [Rubinisphaera margarita]|uniref:Rieske (2Fe-2S) protein n=1 Tax=Rubinisphaera margarita TaxID=2909586 RepID=UPI001EE8AFDD|nr:Rieske (2Fe-2S) protein [Rubinisphaera margarita]MCG6158102.1 Rieske (2Fe-2S) protein [Rubinisphaera margarita]
MKDAVRIANRADFATTSAQVVEFAGRDVVVFAIGENFYAVDNYCPHAGYTLHDGELNGTTVACALHGAEFDLTTGKCVGGVPCEDITAYDVIIDEEGDISIGMEQIDE